MEDNNKTIVNNNSLMENPSNLLYIPTTRNHINNNNNNKLSFVKKNTKDGSSASLTATLIRSLQERVFWTSDQIQEIRIKLREGTKKIKAKQEKDFGLIYSLDKQKRLRKINLNSSRFEFSEFLFEGIPKNAYIRKLLFKGGLPELVVELLNKKSDFFVFNYYFILEYIEKDLTAKSEGKILDTLILKYYFTSSVKHRLYPREMSYLMAFFASFYQLYEDFHSIIEQNPLVFQDDKQIFNNFLSNIDIDNFLQSVEVFNLVVGFCLKNNLENLAVLVFSSERREIDPAIVNIAIEYVMPNFLKYIWEFECKKISEILPYNTSNDEIENNGWINGNNANIPNTINLTNIINPNDNSNNQNNSFNKLIYDPERNTIMENILTQSKFLKNFTLSKLVKEFNKTKESKLISSEIVSKWKYIEYDRGLMNTLFELQSFDNINNIIYRGKHVFWEFTEELFINVIKNEQSNLILFFLGLPHLRYILDRQDIQDIIVHKYMKYGNKMYYGMEMVMKIYKMNWSHDLTKDLCKNILRTIKTKDILNCHSPILTCVILSEFLNAIGSSSILHYSRCEKVVKELMQFCKNVQDSSSDENYINFLMNQKCTNGRSAFQIVAENSFYECLQNPEVGTIVKKMWNGTISNNGLFSASSMHKYINNTTKSLDPFLNFDSLDSTKSYFFQLGVWEDSCLLRYWPESLLTFFLILVYNLYIYFLTNEKSIMKKYNDTSLLIQIFLWMYIIQIMCINFNIIFHVIFSAFTGRRFKLDTWHYFEMILFILSLLLLVDLKAAFGKQSEGFEDYVFIIRAFILCLNDVFVWLRISGILLTFKTLGPVIRMIYLMALLLLKYILVYGLFMICMSAVFTAIFFNSSDQFEDFSTTFITLVGSFLNYFNTNCFKEEIRLFGAIMIMLYSTLAAVLLINLLIAVLSNVYDELNKQVDASNRSVLITYYKRYKWCDEYGYLIFLPTPLSIVNLIFLPIQFCCISSSNIKRNMKNKKKTHINIGGNINNNAESNINTNPSNNPEDCPHTSNSNSTQKTFNSFRM